MVRNYQNSTPNKRNRQSRPKPGFKWTNTRVYSVVEEQQKQVVEPASPERLGRMDKGLIAITLCLIAIGILMVYSASHLLSSRHYEGYSYRYLQIHIIACVLGLVGMFFTSHLPYRFYARFANFFLLLAFIGLLLVFVPGLGTSVQGAEGGRFKRWINVGLPINFQPVEFAKIALVMHVANFISRNPERVKSFFQRCTSEYFNCRWCFRSRIPPTGFRFGGFISRNRLHRAIRRGYAALACGHTGGYRRWALRFADNPGFL